MKLALKLFSVVFLTKFVTSLVDNVFLKIVPDDKIQYCEGDKVQLGELVKGNGSEFDIEFELIDEQTSRINGFMRMIVNGTPPVAARFSGEKFEMGEWHRRVIKTYSDVCHDFYNPLDVYYDYFKDQPHCPLSENVSNIEIY
jgi:hypothetical protein